jgi:hypothetical protein
VPVPLSASRRDLVSQLARVFEFAAPAVPEPNRRAVRPSGQFENPKTFNHRFKNATLKVAAALALGPEPPHQFTHRHLAARIEHGPDDALVALSQPRETGRRPPQCGNLTNLQGARLLITKVVTVSLS